MPGSVPLREVPAALGLKKKDRMNGQNDEERCSAHPTPSGSSGRSFPTGDARAEFRRLCNQKAGPAALIASILPAAKNENTTAP
jgi:hypothetical protein